MRGVSALLFGAATVGTLALLFACGTFGQGDGAPTSPGDANDAARGGDVSSLADGPMPNADGPSEGDVAVADGNKVTGNTEVIATNQPGILSLAASASFLYWTTGTSVMRLSVTAPLGTQPEAFQVAGSQPGSLSVQNGTTIVWGDAKEVFTKPESGGPATPVSAGGQVIDVASAPSGLWVIARTETADVVENLALGNSQSINALGPAFMLTTSQETALWTIPSKATISRSDSTTPLSPQPGCDAITASVSHIYWVNRSTDEIRMKPILASSPDSAMATGETGPFALAIDEALSALYWLTTSGELRVSRSGGPATNVVTGLNQTDVAGPVPSNAKNVAVSAFTAPSFIYFVNYGEGTILRTPR